MYVEGGVCTQTFGIIREFDWCLFVSSFCFMRHVCTLLQFNSPSLCPWRAVNFLSWWEALLVLTSMYTSAIQQPSLCPRRAMNFLSW